MLLLYLTDSNFEKEVLESKIPVLVDFWAGWCTPCKMVTPILEELAREYQGKIGIGKLNVDESPKTTTYCGIMSIPTLIFFKHGKAVEQISGALNKTELKKKIEENL